MFYKLSPFLLSESIYVKQTLHINIYNYYNYIIVNTNHFNLIVVIVGLVPHNFSYRLTKIILGISNIIDDFLHFVLRSISVV